MTSRPPRRYLISVNMEPRTSTAEACPTRRRPSWTTRTSRSANPPYCDALARTSALFMESYLGRFQEPVPGGQLRQQYIPGIFAQRLAL
eukprot:5845314-Pyramimonas_sp.AAC.1